MLAAAFEAEVDAYIAELGGPSRSPRARFRRLQLIFLVRWSSKLRE
jgi:hypothetical protein